MPIYGIVQTDAREENRATFGYHAFAGLMFPIGDRITLSAEFRYHAAKGRFKTTARSRTSTTSISAATP